MKKKVDVANSEEKQNKPFFIVAIGASAGGLEAVTELLQNLPSDTGMAFVYIQHLDPTHKSMLSEILGRATKMKVHEVTDMQPIKENNLYIIPPNASMGVVDGVLTLNERKAKPVKHMPIDEFFISLADGHKEDAVGVILSGNASDGTIGLKAIKEAGGITFAQDDSAKFKSMPASAVSDGAVDMVLSPKEIANELVLISKKSPLIHQQIAAIKAESDEAVDGDVRDIIQLIKKSTGVDFINYKMNTIARRIRRRMLLYKLESLKEYIQYIKQHTNEVNVLYSDLLINVTSFFRDPETMEFLKKILLPNILKNKKPNDLVRIWVPACSTGEEAYSLAILLMEILGDKAPHTAIQIFATDLSETAIAKARQGIYTVTQLTEVSPERLERFFTKTDGHYRIVKAIRDLCVFAPHNIFSDPPFSRLDLVSCCNLMIYLDAAMQKKVLSTFHYALNNNGYLILGKSETVTASTHLFSQVEKKFKVYARKKDADDKAIVEMNYRLSSTERNALQYTLQQQAKKEEKVAPTTLENLVDNVLLTNYLPACVVVGQDLEILQFRGSTGLFLEHSSGTPSFNLMKMARPELAFELRSAIHKSNKTGEAVRKAGLQVKIKREIHEVAIEVIPLKTDHEEKLFIVVFEEIKEPSAIDPKTRLSKDKYVKQLQDEITRVREDMRSIVEEQEASREELQSANEEVVSSNEELQSINEELETAKEEVESTNEELMTINSELQIRNQQLAESYEYAEVMFTIIREAVLVLDENLRIKTANDAFYNIFKLKEEETVGSLIYELSNKQWDFPHLRDLLEKIIPRNTEIEGFKVTHTFPGLGEKVLQLSAKRVMQKSHQRQLILLAMEDITEDAKAEKLLAEREAWFHNMADNAPVMIWVAAPDKLRTFFNKTWLAFTGRKIEQEIGKGWMENVFPDDLPRLLKLYDSSFDEKKPFAAEYRLRRYDGEYRWINVIAKPAYSIEGDFIGYVGSSTEIHDQKMMMNELDKLVAAKTDDLQELNKELERSNNELQQFAYVASHDLQEPLRKIITFSDRLGKYKESLPDKAPNYIEKISSSADRMTHLIDDLLNFSRIASNKKFEDTNLNNILKDVLADFEVVVGEKKAKINYNGLPKIQAIPLQMAQLFHNLISNSLKFSKENKSPVITITSRLLSSQDVNAYPQLDKSKQYCEIIIEDNGIGFDNEFAEQIFVIFQRLEDQKDYPGTGIGLALVRKIVNNHGGAIKAESKQGEGARFKIVLPQTQE